MGFQDGVRFAVRENVTANRTPYPGDLMTLIVHDLALEMARELRPLLDCIGRHDPALRQQMQRAAASVVLNIGEAAYSQGRNEVARFHSAAGSASETRSALKLAVAWGYVPHTPGEVVDQLLDRILAMLWRLCRRRR